MNNHGEEIYRIRLSPYHKIFYNEWKLDPNSSKYNIVFDQTLDNNLNIQRLQKSLSRFVSDYIILDSHIEEINGELQWVKNTYINELEYFSNNYDKEQLYAYASRAFDLENKPLYRFAVFKEGNGNYRFIMVFHHVLIDGTVFDTIISEISNYYNSIDYATKYSKKMQVKTITSITNKVYANLSKLNTTCQQFWQTILSDIDVIDTRFLKLSLCPDALQSRSYQVKEIRFNFNKTVCVQLEYIKNKYKLSLYFYGQMVFAMLLFKYTIQEKFAIAYPINMNHLTNLSFGARTNTNIFPYKIDKQTTLLDLIKQINQLKPSIFQYSTYPIDKILENKNKHLLNIMFGQTNLKDTIFTFVHVKTLSVNSEFNIDLPAKLLFEQETTAETLNYRVRYNANEIDESILKRFTAHYKKLFITILDNLTNNVTDKLVSSYSILDKTEYKQIIYGWNRNEQPYPQYKTIHQLFEEQVKKTPANIAIVWEDKKLTYQELNNRSNQLAHYLRQTYQIKSDDLIALCLTRNEYIIITLLAVLKSGAAYVPIDPDYPVKRIMYILEDVHAKVVISNCHSFKDRNLYSDILMINSDLPQILGKQPITNPNLNVTSSNLAYVIYTSGTTGNPKGVMIEHKGVVNLATAEKREFDLLDNNTIKNCLFYSNYVFDAHVFEIYFPLFNGHCLHIISNGVRQDLNLLNSYIIKNKIVLATIPPALLSIDNVLKVNILVVAGEVANQKVLNKYIENKIKVINAYGPTEATVCTTMKQCNGTSSINIIGKPLANIFCYILDKNLKPLPVGSIGELYIGGDSLARGYLNLPRLTCENFIANPFQTKDEKSQNKNNRIYKTGDLVRYLPDGNIEYIGRNDSQVKLRGYRIELSEIEVVLLQYDGIEHAIALEWENKQNNSKYLIAYYVAKCKLDEAKILDHLHSKLPEYMLPNRLIFIERLPLTTNGKLNKAELPTPEYKKDIFLPARNEQEILVCNAFKKVLSVKQVGITSDFFELGGNSISAISLASILQSNCDISVSDIFDLKTPEHIAKKSTFGINFKKDRLEQVKYLYSSLANKRKCLASDKKKESLYLSDANELKLDKTQLKPINNILLTGATGYLGCNILNQLLLTTNYSVFIIIRANSEESALEKINQKYQYYFNKNLDDYKNLRLYIIFGDLEKPLLGLTEKKYQYLIEQIDSIIHSAALVKHYGEYSQLYAANVQATINLLEFAKLTKLKDFHYISTSSILHTAAANSTLQTIYTEDDVPHDLSACQNVYIRSKFQGEQQVIKYRQYGINGNIYRIGNLAFMLQNYCLHENIENNAFFYWLKCVFKIGNIAKELELVELTPTDLTAQAIVKLFDKSQLNNANYHLFNPNLFKISGVYLNYNVPNINALPMKQFIDCLIWYLDKNIYTNLINRFLLFQGWLDNNSIAINKVKILQDRTLNILKQLNFKWIEINEDVFGTYITRIKDHLFDYTGMNIMVKKSKMFEYLEMVVPILPAPIYWLDTNNVLLGANEAALKMTGAPSLQDIIGKRAFDVYPQEMAEHIVLHDKEVMRTGKILSQIESTKNVQTGEIRYVLSVKAPLRDEDGIIIGIVGTSIDITAEKEAENLKIENAKHALENEKQQLLLEQQEKFKKIVDQVVHDIRSPIASMQMILPSCKKLPETERVSLNKAASRIMDIANRLLNEVKPVKHEVSDNKIVPTLISSEILEVVAEKRFEYKQRAIDFCAHISQDGYFTFLNINSSDFKRMLSNLINNAVDAIKDKIGKIDLYLDTINSQIQVIVQDNGSGMPHQVKEKILNNISVTAGKTDGHGIGFSQIRDTLENSNGKLDIESSTDVGTRIILTFPQANSPDWIAQKIELFNDDTIVILDDDESIHGAWEARFKKASPNIIRKHFQQGEEAIAFINNLEPTKKEKVFLLTDYELLDQGLHGLHVVKQTGITRSILVTSHHNSKEVRELAKLHNTKILPKPLAPHIPINIAERETSSEVFTQESTSSPQVDLILADDDAEFSKNFARFMAAHERTVDKYNSASEFVNNIPKYSKDSLILIDNEFAQEKITGIEIAKQLHSMGFSRLYLFSGRDYSNDPSIPTYLTPILKTDLDYVLRILNK